MKFGNNMEAMGFEKCGWSLIEISSDGNTVYRGKTSSDDAHDDSPVWLIQRTVITTSADGAQLIRCGYSEPCVRWTDRHSLTYKY